MRVLATAGHVDHGKSTLVWALTGVDPDRWPEEKARGMTIDLGFAAASLPSGEEVGFVDVPGHGRLVRNMLAGVGGADACLFVVAATEGWKEQSEEHLRILELMGVRDGLVALTKVGLVDEEWGQIAAMEVRDHLAGTFLQGAETVEVDVPAGRGLDELRAALDRLVARVPPAADAGRPRLWVDRSFSVRGSGTVVTGTLTGGSLAVGDEVVVEPGGHRCRIRSLQSHHHSLERASPGRRLAVNLTGVQRAEVRRGMALVAPGQWHLSCCFDACLSVLASVGHPVDRRGAFSVHVGSREVPAKLSVIGGGAIEPGSAGAVRLWSRDRAGLPLVPGDRYVLREAGRFETVGGGEVLDVEPVLPVSRARPSRSVQRVVQERGWVDAGHLARITGEAVTPNVGRWVADPEALAGVRSSLLARCREAGPAGLDVAALDAKERAVVAAGLEGAEVRSGRLVDSTVPSERLSGDAERLLSALESGKWSPPAVSPADRAALRELSLRGLAVDAGGEWFAASAVQSAVQLVAQLLESRPEGFTVSEARDLLSSTRKHVLPLLAHLDSTGVTRRRGDVRVAGPRLGGLR
jgi:selenocysteine-specific elongation factor